MSGHSQFDREGGFPWLEPENMDKWDLLLKVHLRSKKCIEALDKNKPAMEDDKFYRMLDPEGEETLDSLAYREKTRKKAKKWQKADHLATALIVKSCYSNPTAMILIQDNPDISARELVGLLRSRFHLKDQVGVIQAKLAEFNTMQFEKGETIENFTTRILTGKLRLNGLGCSYVDNEVFCLGRLKEALLQDGRFHELGLSLKTTQHLDWDRAIRLCTEYEQTVVAVAKTETKRARDDTIPEQVRRLKVKFNKTIKSLKKNYQKGSSTCSKCGKSGHTADKCWSGGDKKKGDNRKCFNCDKVGHIAKDCRAPKKEKSEVTKHNHVDDFSDDFCGMLREHTGQKKMPHQSLIMDSGATSHMVPQTLAQKVKDSDLVAQERTVETAKQGVNFRSTHRGRLGNLHDTLVTEDGVLTEAVASVARFDVNGQYVLFGGGKALLMDANLDVQAEALLGTDMSYRFNLSDLVGEKVLLGNASPREDLQLWHNRLGHRNKRDLGFAIKQKLLYGPSEKSSVHIKDGLCDPCMRAKSTRRSVASTSISSSSSQVPKVLKPLVDVVEEVVTDLKGPFSVSGINGEKYLQIYTESATKFRVAKCMATKDMAIENTKQFMSQDLASEGQKLLQLHSDGAPELISKETVAYLADKGCRVTYSPSYTPEKNGLAERSNRIIWESAYSMWIASSLPASYWTYATNYAIICTNMLPTDTKQGWITPFQAKYGVAPDVTKFKVFGCIAYVHVPEQLRDSTFADKAYKGFFLGFTWPLLDRYIILVPELDKVLESLHATFDEITPVIRKGEELLIVDSTRKVLKDFYFLIDMVYKDEDNNMLYVTTRVTTNRGFIVGFRAPITQGQKGQDEPRPIHAKEIELMLIKYWHMHAPVMWSNNKLTNVCDEYISTYMSKPQGAPRSLPAGADHPTNPAHVAKTLSGGRQGGSPSAAVNRNGGGEKDIIKTHNTGAIDSAGSSINVDSSRSSVSGVDIADVVSKPSGRNRVMRRPLNVANMGDIGERASYLAVEALDLIDEKDDAATCWDVPKASELHAHVLEHKTYKVVDLPVGRTAITAKWVVKEKTQPVHKLKARFTPRGFGQVENVDYKETFAPVAKLVTLRVFLSLVAIMGLHTSQIDIKTAFLNAELEEEIYCRPLYDQVRILIVLYKSLTDDVQKDIVADQIKKLRRGGVLLLLKAIYGLKQAPRAWWQKLHAFLKSIGFVANAYDVCFYVLRLAGGASVLLLLYVDDIIMAASSKHLLDYCCEVYSTYITNPVYTHIANFVCRFSLDIFSPVFIMLCLL